MSTFGPQLQAAIRSARTGKHLPEMSQHYPFSVSNRALYFAVYSLGGPLWLASYIAYDPVDLKATDAGVRVARLLDDGGCYVSARSIGQLLPSDGDLLARPCVFSTACTAGQVSSYKCPRSSCRGQFSGKTVGIGGSASMPGLQDGPERTLTFVFRYI